MAREKDKIKDTDVIPNPEATPEANPPAEETDREKENKKAEPPPLHPDADQPPTELLTPQRVTIGDPAHETRVTERPHSKAETLEGPGELKAKDLFEGITKPADEEAQFIKTIAEQEKADVLYGMRKLERQREEGPRENIIDAINARLHVVQGPPIPDTDD